MSKMLRNRSENSRETAGRRAPSSEMGVGGECKGKGRGDSREKEEPLSLSRIGTLLLVKLPV